MSANPGLYKLPTSTRSRRRALAVLGLTLLAAAVAVSLSVAASRIAVRTNFSPELGPPLTAPLSAGVRVSLLFVLGLGLTSLILFRRWRYLPAGVGAATAVALVTAYPAYSPSAYLLARRAFAEGPYEGLLRDSNLWSLASLAVLFTAALPFLRPMFAALVRTGDLHGSARLARPEDILRAGGLRHRRRLEAPWTVLCPSSWVGSS
jgi:hypothetical protein